MNEAYLLEFARRYLRRYHGAMLQAGHAPRVAAALWIPAASDPFVGVSQWFERQLDLSVAFSLDVMAELSRRVGVGLPGFHGLCAEPVALSKALGWLKRGGYPDPIGAVAGGRCLAVQISADGFGKHKNACASCGMLLRAFNIQPL
jgi:hypothetical protein